MIVKVVAQNKRTQSCCEASVAEESGRELEDRTLLLIARRFLLFRQLATVSERVKPGVEE